MSLIKLLCRIPFIRESVLKYAFEVKYGDSKDEAKLTYRFTTSDGSKYFTYVKPDFIPITRWNEIEVRLMEMSSRINRETLQEFSKLTRVAAEKKDLITVARLQGELEDRIELLYDPHALIRLICATYIREDQTRSAGIWNDEIENDKFEQIKKDLMSGSLSFFLISQDLERFLAFSTTSDSDLKMFEKKLLNNQIKQVEKFDHLVSRLKDEISKQG